jgi:hypothetical protein
VAEGGKEEAIKGQQDKQRRSPRLSAKSEKGKLVLKLIQYLVAKKCGLLQTEDPQEDMTLQQYLNMFKEPLSDNSMQAILKLTEVAVGKEKKKSNKSKGMQKDNPKMNEADKMVPKKKKGLKCKKQAPVGA